MTTTKTEIINMNCRGR